MRYSIALLGATAAVVAAAPSPQFIVQDSSASSLPLAATELQDLTIEDFNQVQDSLKHAFDKAADHLSNFDQSVSNKDDEITTLPNPFPHHPPPVLDFSHLTILEIVNASLGHHHEDHEHRRGSKNWMSSLFDKSDDRKDDPSHLPLHRLAWLVNFSSDAQEYLKQDDITLLAPDDMALTPPHRRGGGEHPHHGQAESFDHYAADQLDLDKSSLAHPFHSKEFSPKHLSKLSSHDHDDDEDKEKKREFFKKLIAYIGKYHVVRGRREAHDFAEVSTAATLLEESRVNVRPGFDFLPIPHPTVKFNYYSKKRGPTIKAKNGIIHLVSAPLFPPFTPLNELFLFPQYFSSLTSGIQKVGLDEPLLPSRGLDVVEEEEPSSVVEELVNELVGEKGIKSFTVFAPGNFAFARVPAQLLAGLHSPFPFAKKILKYVLAYHVVPDTIFFSDFLKNDSSVSSVEKYIVKEETDVEVPLDWILDGPQPAKFIAEEIETREWKMPSFPRPGPPRGPRGRGPPPPPPSPPHKGPRGRPPLPPRRGEEPHPPPPPPHHPPPPPPHDEPHHSKCNVTHYELPTLLSADNANATLKVAVVSYRMGPGGHGPLKRSIVVFPHRPPHHHHDSHHERVDVEEGLKEKSRMMCPHQDPFRPIRVSFSDLPARSGAIHVLPRIIPPPPPPHHHHDDDDDKKSTDSLIQFASKHEAKKLRKALARMFSA